jgi:hypothetical protein
VSVQYDASKDNWWLSVGGFTVGDVHRSLTNKLLRDRWLTCAALENARIAGQSQRAKWVPVEVHIMKNGEPQSTDVI